MKRLILIALIALLGWLLLPAFIVRSIAGEEALRWHGTYIRTMHQVSRMNYLLDNRVTARITEYGWTGYRTASGKWPEVGMVATSDRTIPFGTKVLIDGKEYTVEDRTAKWVHDKFDMPTFDVYSETPQGLSITEVIINI